MNVQGLMRLLWAVVFGIVCAAATSAQGLNKVITEPDYKLSYQEEKRQNKPKYIYPNWTFNLLILFLLIPIFLLISPLKTSREDLFLHLMAPILFSICSYYLLLVPAVPLLRKIIHPYACAILWMIPSTLYISCYSWMRRSKPVHICIVPGQWIRYGLRIWAAGFAIFLTTSILQHLYLRRKLLFGAHPCSDPKTNQLFNERKMEYCGDKNDYRLLMSGSLQTPLSIGLFQRNICVILPERNYSEEDLDLIFRHEFIHICRRDSGVKFLITFCSALCWFNPLMPLARRRCSEDMELSCDRLVLKDAGQTHQKRYAELILDTAAETRGFTTCLSADARSIAYRLKQILLPQQKWKGTILVGLSVTMLLISLGWFSFVCNAGTVKELCMDQGSADPSEWTISSISQWETIAMETRNVRSGLQTSDPQALTEFIASLQCLDLAGNYTLQEDGPKLNVWYQNNAGLSYVTVSENTVTLGHPIKTESPGDSYTVSVSYLLNEPADMDHLLSLISQ